MTRPKTLAELRANFKGVIHVMHRCEEGTVLACIPSSCLHGSDDDAPRGTPAEDGLVNVERLTQPRLVLFKEHKVELKIVE